MRPPKPKSKAQTVTKKAKRGRPAGGSFGSGWKRDAQIRMMVQCHVFRGEKPERAFELAEDEARNMGWFGVRGEGPSERGEAMKQAFFRAKRAGRKRDARLHEIAMEEYRARGLEWPDFKKQKGMTELDQEILTIAMAREYSERR